MAQTFDIRFDATDNSFGWRGGGEISIDAQGLSFALKRGIASLWMRRRSQRIPAVMIREVYREGEALRVEFATAENPLLVIPFHARDREAASQIVQLMPTLRSFEVEHEAVVEEKRRLPWIAAAAIVAVLAVAMLVGRDRSAVNPQKEAAFVPVPVAAPVAAPGVAAAIPPTEDAGGQTTAAVPAPPVPDRFTTPDEARKLAMLAEDPTDWTTAPPGSAAASAEHQARLARFRDAPPAPAEDAAFVPMELPEIELAVDASVVRIPTNTLAYESARDLLRAFEAEAGALAARYRGERERLRNGTLDDASFAARLDALEIRWRAVANGLLAERRYADAALDAMRGTLLTVVVQQRMFLVSYAAGLRAGDRERIERSFAELARADAAMARARAYVD